MANHARRRESVGLMAFALVVLSGTNASADVLYDTTNMVDSGIYSMAGSPANSLVSYIGYGINNGGVPAIDIQTCDDFALTGNTAITSVTADFTTLNQWTMVAPRTGVLVEFFPDLGGVPSNDVQMIAPGQPAQFLATPAMFTATNFVHNGTGNNNLTGLRLTVDLTSAGITLPAGIWWMSVVPVDETPEGIFYRNVSRAGTLGGNAHRRGGGSYHGNSYANGGTSGFWVPTGAGGVRDLSYRVEGHSIPAPTGIALATLGGIFAGRRRRIA